MVIDRKGPTVSYSNVIFKSNPYNRKLASKQQWNLISNLLKNSDTKVFGDLLVLDQQLSSYVC